MLRTMRALLLAVLLFPASACVERKLTIVTVPSLADVYVDGAHVGRSPLTLPFTYYGTSEIVVRKDGYVTQQRMETRQPPYFQRFPTDFYYETLTSDLYVDHRTYSYELEPQPETAAEMPAVEAAMQRAGALRVR